MRVQYSPLPDKLLRIEVSRICNYRCRFCCWKRPRGERGGMEGALLDPEACRSLLWALAESGCSRVMLTGGEPLLAPRDRLLGMVRGIAAHPGSPISG